MIREAALNQTKPGICQLVIDSGHSFTQLVPYFDGLPLKFASKRIDVGGKLMTNLLCETLSYKEVNLLGESYIVNQMKESLSFVSQDFDSDLHSSTQTNFRNNKLMKEFVLPDYKNVK